MDYLEEQIFFTVFSIKIKKETRTLKSFGPIIGLGYI